MKNRLNKYHSEVQKDEPPQPIELGYGGGDPDPTPQPIPMLGCFGAMAAVMIAALLCQAAIKIATIIWGGG